MKNMRLSNAMAKQIYLEYVKKDHKDQKKTD